MVPVNFLMYAEMLVAFSRDVSCYIYLCLYANLYKIKHLDLVEKVLSGTNLLFYIVSHTDSSRSGNKHISNLKKRMFEYFPLHKLCDMSVQSEVYFQQFAKIVKQKNKYACTHKTILNFRIDLVNT